MPCPPKASRVLSVTAPRFRKNPEWHTSHRNIHISSDHCRAQTQHPSANRAYGFSKISSSAQKRIWIRLWKLSPKFSKHGVNHLRVGVPDSHETHRMTHNAIPQAYNRGANRSLFTITLATFADIGLLSGNTLRVTVLTTRPIKPWQHNSQRYPFQRLKIQSSSYFRMGRF